jgi:hypothetical protein
MIIFVGFSGSTEAAIVKVRDSGESPNSLKAFSLNLYFLPAVRPVIVV